jgi:hypothetical protein
MLCGLLIAVSPVRASAEWQLTPFLGFSFRGDTNLTLADGVRERHWNFGGSVRLVGAGILGVESIFVYVPGHLESAQIDPIFGGPPPGNDITQSRSLGLMGNVVLTTPRGWNEYGLRPFVSGGLGLLHAFNNEGRFPVRLNLLGYNVGGGAVGLLTERVGLRFDLRFYRTVPPGQEPTEGLTIDSRRVRLRYWTGAVGVVFKY